MDGAETHFIHVKNVRQEMQNAENVSKKAISVKFVGLHKKNESHKSVNDLQALSTEQDNPPQIFTGEIYVGEVQQSGE